MEVAMVELQSLLPKLAELLDGEYKLQKDLREKILFIRDELQSMKAVLEKISMTPADQLDYQDRIWARKVTALSYDIEDSVDAFMVRGRGSQLARLMRFKRFNKRCRSIADEIRDVEKRVVELSERRRRYKIDTAIAKPVTLDPRPPARYANATELVGIDEARNQVIKILMEDSEVSKQQVIISIVGFGGLGKTTLANVVYEKLKGQFDCSAFVSDTPDMEKLFKGMLRQLDKEKYGSINGETWDEGQLIDRLRELLHGKRYLIVIDDIRHISYWEVIKCALPDNNVGCKIITTTRNLDVAQQVGFVYEMEPLSPQNSRKLLYRRIFSNENKDNNVEPERCPDEELSEVSERILTKCAGVPLAIITIGSLLASKGRNKMEWYEVYNSIDTGMEHSLYWNDMRKILSYSYYDLPSHLKICLLYLNMFPKDFEIEKDRLIWLWIAEGFIKHEEHGKSLFVLGESYFNELINRSLIQPVDSYTGMIYHCRVQDMVLNLIHSLSSEENLVTTLTGLYQISASTTVRRLSLHNVYVYHAASTQATMSVSKVRSVVVFPSACKQIPALRSFKILRVLDLQRCNLSQGYSLKYLGSLFHLRYLSLRSTRIDQLPKEVGNLQYLQTLDIWGNKISFLPSTIAQLKHLLCLYVDSDTKVPNGIGSLRSLEDLSRLRIDDESTGTIEELGLLTELRVLQIVLFTDKWKDKLVESLRKLPKIQTLSCITESSYGGRRNMCGLDAWVAPRLLRTLNTRELYWFSTLPAWMNNPSHLPDLSVLEIAVRELQQEELETLGRLPSLRYLDIKVDHEDLGTIERFIVSAGSFPVLVRYKLWGFVGPVVFQQGTMPRLQCIEFDFYVWAVRELAGSDDDGFDFGLGNLPSLQEVKVVFRSRGASKEEVD